MLATGVLLYVFIQGAAIPWKLAVGVGKPKNFGAGSKEDPSLRARFKVPLFTKAFLTISILQSL